MKTRAAIAWKAGQDLTVETVDLEGPKAGEVLVEIKATGVCHTDAFTLSGDDPEGAFPAILGHEGAGVVLEVGAGVTSLKPGDHVIPLYTPECRECDYCLHPKTNLCQAIRSTQGQGLMPDGTSRFSIDGTPILHYMGCSTFANHTVLPEIALAKVRPDAPFEKICYIGCGVTTGVGAVVYDAKVEPGSNVVVFGLGGIGLNVIQGARMVGANKIIGVDINNAREDMGRQFGMTDFINPQECDVMEAIMDLTNGGADYSFECIGNVNTMRQALECCHKGWGESIIIGVAGAGQEISTRPFQLVTGRVWRGSAFGGARGRTDVPQIVDWYMDGKINIDDLITHTMPLDDINKAFHLMHEGESIRSVVVLLMSVTAISETACFSGKQGTYEHRSNMLDCMMRFSVFTPPPASDKKVPVLWYLSGLTCTEENATVKAGFQRVAAELGLMVICPDTSPRGDHVPDIDEWDFAKGAGFYLNATKAPWADNFRMYDYIVRELPQLVAEHFPADMKNQGITGHSMGGHGALTIWRKNPETYKSVSAFAPIVAPMACDWGTKAFSNYLGDDESTWQQYDACALLKDHGPIETPILVDQGLADPFLENQLKPELLEKACSAVGQDLILRRHEGYDHGYFFISSFIEDHLRHHANWLRD